MWFRRCANCQTGNETEMENLRMALLICGGIYCSTYLPDIVDYCYIKITDLLSRFWWITAADKHILNCIIELIKVKNRIMKYEDYSWMWIEDIFMEHFNTWLTLSSDSYHGYCIKIVGEIVLLDICWLAWTLNSAINEYCIAKFVWWIIILVSTTLCMTFIWLYRECVLRNA